MWATVFRVYTLLRWYFLEFGEGVKVPAQQEKPRHETLWSESPALGFW